MAEINSTGCGHALASYDERLERAVSVMNSTASAISEIAKLMPRTGKRGRNLLRKSYNRRPRNRQKQARAEAAMTVVAVMGAFQIAKIKSTPVFKYLLGAPEFQPAIIGDSLPDRPYRGFE